MKTSAFIATSLDGFIARENGEIDWLEERSDGGGEDYGYREFMDTVDFLVMGRNSYEKVLTFPGWPYGVKPVVVLTNHSIRIPEHIAKYVETMTCSPAELVSLLSRRRANHLYIDGGKTIQGFLNAGLMSRLIVTTIPILLGTGIPLFGPLEHDIRLRHVQTRQFSTGLVQSEYEVLT